VRLHLLTIGKPRAAGLAAAADDYRRRLERYGEVDWTVVAAAEVAPRARPADVAAALAKEGERLLAKLPAGGLFVALDRTGRALSSEELARELARWQREERVVACAVGGAHGLAPAVVARARLRLSLSPFTLPHELALVVLLEQLYRAHTILRGEPYHK
jgi:23S rRNA (pseudouridine1915-N3)-methyltransferase